MATLAHDWHHAPRRTNARPSAGFMGACGALLVLSAAGTVISCTSMSTMEVVGGGSMSMAWMRMPGQTWPGAAASFLLMWVVMMVAMMLPSLAPVLWRYREAVAAVGEARHLGLSIASVGVGYFFVWALLGIAVYPLGALVAAGGMEEPAVARAVPVGAAGVVVLAGLLQFTAWKARRLSACREAPDHGPSGKGRAFQYGLRLGLDCSRCCANLMAIPLVLGVMDLPVMALVTAAISAERLLPRGDRIARSTGAFAIGAGLILVGKAAGLL